MKEKTRQYKKAYQCDVRSIYAPKASAQSRADKIRFYRAKWEHMQADADTQAQKHWCRRMFDVIDRAEVL